MGNGEGVRGSRANGYGFISEDNVWKGSCRLQILQQLNIEGWEEIKITVSYANWAPNGGKLCNDENEGKSK